MSTAYLSTARTAHHGRTGRVQAASDLFAVTLFSGLGLIASLLFVASGGQIAF